MSDEIYINTGTTIQQPYQAQAPSNAQQPVTAQQVRQITASARQPGTYSTRTPFTYGNPSSGQTPSIGQSQAPFTYVTQGQTPFIYTLRSPFTYARQGQTPFTYQHRSPFTYARQGQTPVIYTFQQPSTYQHPASNQQPTIKNAQQPVAYRHPSEGRQPLIYTYQQPSTYARQGQTPFTYSRTGQTPIIYSFQSPFTYARQGQTPFTYQHQTQVPYTFTTASSVATQNQGRQPYIYAAYTYTNHMTTGTTNPVHTLEANAGDEDTCNVYIWCKYNGNNIEIYTSISVNNNGSGSMESNSGSAGLTHQNNYKIATIVDAGTGYKVRYTAGSWFSITQVSGEPAVIPSLTGVNIPNSTSTTGGATINTNTLWGAGNVNYLRGRVSALSFDSTFDGSGSASASINTILYFDKSGSTQFTYSLLMIPETDYPESMDGFDGE